MSCSETDGVGVNEYKFRWAPFGVKMTVGVVGGLWPGQLEVLEALEESLQLM